MEPYKAFITKGGVASCPAPRVPIASSCATSAPGRQMGHMRVP